MIMEEEREKSKALANKITIWFFVIALLAIASYANMGLAIFNGAALIAYAIFATRRNNA